MFHWRNFIRWYTFQVEACSPEMEILGDAHKVYAPIAVWPVWRWPCSVKQAELQAQPTACNHPSWPGWHWPHDPSIWTTVTAGVYTYTQAPSRWRSLTWTCEPLCQSTKCWKGTSMASSQNPHHLEAQTRLSKLWHKAPGKAACRVFSRTLKIHTCINFAIFRRWGLSFLKTLREAMEAQLPWVASRHLTRKTKWYCCWGATMNCITGSGRQFSTMIRREGMSDAFHEIYFIYFNECKINNQIWIASMRYKIIAQFRPDD